MWYTQYYTLSFNMSNCSTNLFTIDWTVIPGNRQCQKLFLWVLVAVKRSGTGPFVWAVTEAFLLCAYKPNARYSWLAVDTWYSSFFFFPLKSSHPPFGKKRGGSFASGFISFSDSLSWDVSKYQWRENGVFSKYLSTCRHAKHSVVMTNPSGRLAN